MKKTVKTVRKPVRKQKPKSKLETTIVNTQDELVIGIMTAVLMAGRLASHHDMRLDDLDGQSFIDEAINLLDCVRLATQLSWAVSE